MDDKSLSQQLEEIQKSIEDINTFVRESFDKLLNKKKVETPKKVTPVEAWRKDFDQALKYYTENFNKEFTDSMYCTYVPKKNTTECCGNNARYILLGDSEKRIPEPINDETIYNVIVENFKKDANNSFSKFRCSSCKGKGLKDANSKCEELIGKQGQTDQIHESASSPKTRNSSTRKTTPAKILSPKDSEYTDRLITLDNGTSIITRKIKAKRSPAFIIGKLNGGNNVNYIDNLVKPTSEEITKSGLKYEEIVKNEIIIDNNSDEDADDDDDDDNEVNILVSNLS